jgi:hypothetical protein
MPEITPMKLQCDLVMRGGIASGIVYPRVGCRGEPLSLRLVIRERLGLRDRSV